MDVIKTLRDTKTLFPEIVTNEFINSMPRRELTEEEKALPYAKYYYKDMARIPEEDLALVNAGPIDPSLALLDANRTDIISDCHQRNSGLVTLAFYPQMDMESEEYVYFISVRTGILTSLLTAWVRTGGHKTPEELIALMTGYLEEAMKGDILL